MLEEITVAGDVRAAVAPRKPRYPRGTGGCRNLPMHAGGCRNRIPARKQGLWLSAPRPDTFPDFNGKEGVAGSSPAEGSREPRHDAVFLF